MEDKEKIYKQYKEWSVSVYGKLPFKWRQIIIKKHFQGLGEIQRRKIYHALWNTYTGHSHNLLYIKYINELKTAHEAGKDYLNI